MTDQNPRTFADMTPEERDQCYGMWCDVIRHDAPAVLHECFFPSHGQYGAGLYSPNEGSCFYVAAKYVTPRFDLPRAWNPDGTPVDADPEDYVVEATGFVQLADGGGAQRTPFPPGTKVRRWVSDWEAVE